MPLRTRTASLLLLSTFGCAAPTDDGAGVPTIGTVSPPSVLAGSAAFELTVTGTRFVERSVVRWDGDDLVTMFVSSTELRAAVGAARLVSGDTAKVSVVTSSPGGGTSVTRDLLVNNPVPTIASLSTDSVLAGMVPEVVTVSGTGFVPTTRVLWNGAALETAFQSATQVTFTPPVASLATKGTNAVRIRNSVPGGGTTASLDFHVVPSGPVLGPLMASGIAAGRGAFTLTLAVQDVEEGTVLLWNGVERAVERPAAARMTVDVAAAEVAAPGNITLQLRSPPLLIPGDRYSETRTLTIHPVGAPTSDVLRVPFAGLSGLAWDPAGHLLVSFGDAGGAYAGTVARIDPATGTVVDTVHVGGQPFRMHARDDGSILYVAIGVTNRIDRVSLATFSLLAPITLPTGLRANDIESEPGSASAIAVARVRTAGLSTERVVIYDGTIARPGAGPDGGPSHVTYVDGGLWLFGTREEGYWRSDDVLFAFPVTSSGVTAPTTSPATDLDFISGLGHALLSRSGAVLDPVLGTLEAPFVGLAGLYAFDRPAGRLYRIATDEGIKVHDILSRELLGTVPLSDFGVLGATMVRWGADGFAFYNETELVIVRSPLIAP